MKVQNAYDQVMETLRGVNAFADASDRSKTSIQVSEAFGIANSEFAMKFPGTIRFEIEGGANSGGTGQVERPRPQPPATLPYLVNADRCWC